MVTAKESGPPREDDTEPAGVSLRGAALGLLSLVAVTAVVMIALQQVGGLGRVQRAVAGAGAWAPVLFILLKASTFVIAPLSGTALKVSAGALFGLWEGTLYTLAGDVLGGSANFWIARLLGRRVVARAVGEKGMARVDALGQQFGDWRGMLFARVFLAAVYDFVSYAAGLTKLPYRHYVLVTGFGGILPILFFVSLGASFGGDSEQIVWLVAGLGVLFLVAILLRGRIWRALRRDPTPEVETSADNSPNRIAHR